MLKQKIVAEIKAAMLSKDTVKRDILRVVIGDIERNEQTPKGKVEVSDEDILKIIKKMVESIELTTKNQEEIDILTVYLPKQLDEAEVRAIIGKLITELNANSMKDMGRIMGTFNSKYTGMADGKLVSTIVKESLI